MLLKGCKLLCLSINPCLPPPAASFVSGFSVINSAFPDGGEYNLNPLSISRDRRSVGAHLLTGGRCSGGPGRAAGTEGRGSGRCPKGDEKLIRVTVLYSELGCAVEQQPAAPVGV